MSAERKAGMRVRAGAAWHALTRIGRARRSVRGQLMLVVLLTSTVALLVAGTALLLTDLRENRRTWANDLVTEAGILALASAPALSFDDRRTATRNLAALQARASIHAAALYTSDGRLYATYVRPGEAPAPAQQPALRTGVHIDGERLEVLRPIVQSGETLGAIYLLAHYDVNERVKAYARILATVLLASLFVALVASRRLQRVISEPLESMARVAHDVVERRDYSLRAHKTARDEIGLVVDAFNNMLDEVDSHARALESANAALNQQITERLAAEHAARASEQLYRAIGESIDYGVWICDAAGRNIYASDSFLRLTGITQEQCSEFRWAQALHPDDREATIAAWQQCVLAGSPWYREHRILGSDGRYHEILAQGMPIRDESGAIIRWAGINLDISRLKQTEQALREADRRKDEFLATLAHELRNPLAPIRNAVQIMELATASEPQRRWGRQVIARQVRHMALLLDDLLDVSRITRGQLELKKDYVELASVIEAAVETARPLLESKQHALSVSLPASTVRLEADPLRLSQVLANLLTNAAKYTDAGGQIALTASLVDEGLVLSVKDNGIGLSPATIPGLFTMFSQVNSAIDRAEGGLGIGLALVKGLVALHRGTVEACSEGLGRGSEFIVRLPQTMVLARASGPAATPILHEQVKPIGRKILIADDNRDAAETLATVFALSGHEVTTAFSGPEALAAAARQRPHAILLDIGMPGLSGYEVARRIRLEAWGRRTILVALTGWGQEDDRQKAKAAGFDLHLTKPVDPADVSRVLLQLLASREPSAPTAISLRKDA
jgi:PAS domain S-box-containing protein